jgi:hypothetical protein
MSFTQKQIINQFLNWQIQKSEESLELRRLTKQYRQNERTKKAKDVAFGEKLEGLRNQFTQFFSMKPQEGQP